MQLGENVYDDLSGFFISILNENEIMLFQLNKIFILFKHLNRDLGKIIF